MSSKQNLPIWKANLLDSIIRLTAALPVSNVLKTNNVVVGCMLRGNQRYAYITSYLSYIMNLNSF